MHKVQYVSIKGKMMTLKNTLNAYLLLSRSLTGFLPVSMLCFLNMDQAILTKMKMLKRIQKMTGP